MAGHSKWANIKHKKANQDAKRGKIFTKLIRELVVATKTGGNNICDNPRLRAAYDKALANNMKKDTIEKAIMRGVVSNEGDDYLEVRYEGYGPNGTAIMADCLTDNKQRTVSEIRYCLAKKGGKLGTNGSVSYMFNKIGVIEIETPEEDRLFEIAINSGATDMQQIEKNYFMIYTEPHNFLEIQNVLHKHNFKLINSQITYSASNKIALDSENLKKVLSLIDMLENLDDVQNVYTNANLDDYVSADVP